MADVPGVRGSSINGGCYFVLEMTIPIQNDVEKLHGTSLHLNSYLVSLMSIIISSFHMVVRVCISTFM
jgi:hypothetical protein